MEGLRVIDGRAPLRVIAPGILFLALFRSSSRSSEWSWPSRSSAIPVMMQLTGWGIRHGLKLYRDTGTTDGPYIHFLQAASQIAFGESDRALRVGDIVLQIAGSVFMGALAAPPKGLSSVARRASQFIWSTVSVIVWMSYYLSLWWPSTTNREAFYSVVGCAGMAALYVSGTLPDGAGRIAGRSAA